MRYIALAILMFLLTITILFFGFLPDYTVEVRKQRSFVIDKSFNSVRRAIANDEGISSILTTGNAQVIEERWLDKEFCLEKPLSKERYWYWKGTIYTKSLVKNKHGGKMMVYTYSHIYIDQEKIHLKVELTQPMSVGITDRLEEIRIEPYGENHTIVYLKVYLKLERPVPGPWKNYARNEVDKVAIETIRETEIAIRQASSQERGLLFRQRKPVILCERSMHVSY
jgi:hypothetical protein